MARKKTLEQKYYDLDREFDKKRYEMEKRVDIKREKKHKKDQDRISTEKKNKNKQLEKKKHLKKMNIKHIHNNELEKVKKMPRKKSNIKKEAVMRHNRYEKLKYVFQSGNAFFWMCHTHVISKWETKKIRVVKYENWKFRRNQNAQAWHQIKKWSWESLLFYSPVFRLQCWWCNCFTSEDQYKRELQRKEEVWEKEYDEAIRVKNIPFDMSAKDIEAYGKEMKKKVMKIIEVLK